MKIQKFKLVYTNPHNNRCNRTEIYDSKDEALTQMRFYATHDAFNSDVAESHVDDMFGIDYDDFKKQVAAKLFPTHRYDQCYNGCNHNPLHTIRLGKDDEEGEFTPDQEAEEIVMQEADKLYNLAVEEAIKNLDEYGYSLDGKSYKIEETEECRCDYCDNEIEDPDWDNLELTEHFCDENCEKEFKLLKEDAK